MSVRLNRLFSGNVRARVGGRCQGSPARVFFRRPLVIDGRVPFISLTFDDCPRSPFYTGGAMLKRFGPAGTYSASYDLMEKRAPTGKIFVADYLTPLLQQGHELRSHTFSHCHLLETRSGAFEKSIIQDEAALRDPVPGASFRTFSHAITPPRPQTKRRAAEHFACCRC